MSVIESRENYCTNICNAVLQEAADIPRSYFDLLAFQLVQDLSYDSITKKSQNLVIICLVSRYL